MNLSGVTINDGNGGANYTVTLAGNSVSTINPLAVTLTAPTVTKTYDGGLTYTTTPSNLTSLDTSLVGGDTVTAATIGYANKNAGTGNKTVNLNAVTLNDGNGGANYTVTLAGNSVSTINPLAVTLTAPTVTKTYDGGLTYTTTLTNLALLDAPLISGDTVTAATIAYTNTNAGTGNKAVNLNGVTINDGNGGANYTVTLSGNNVSTIAQAPLTVTGLSGTNRTYNGNTVDALTGTALLSGLISGQSLTLGNTVNGTLLSANAGNEAVSTAITIANNGIYLASNYVLTQPVLANVTIAQAPLTVTGLSAINRNYNGSTVDVLSGTATLNGLVSGQSLTLGSTTNGTLASANAGSEAVSTAITIANGTGLSSNYVLTQPTLANVTIAQAPLTVSGLSGTNRTYNGSTIDALTGTAVLSGLVGTETLTLGNTANGTLASANAGSEAVTTAITIANGTGLSSNYALKQSSLTNVTIAQAPLTVTGLSGTSRTYDGTTVDALTGTALLSGLIKGQSLTLGNTVNGTLASANAGSEAVGTAITIANGTGLSSNYVLTQPTLANVTIAQAPLTVSGLSGTNRTYNGSTIDALTGTAVLSGLVGTETLTLGNTANGTLASANAGSEAVTTAITIANGTGLSSNYALKQSSLTNVTIAQAPLTVTGLSGTSRTYDGTTVDALTGTALLSGLIKGQSLTLGNTVNGTLASANAGSEAVGTAITIANGTGLSSNYVLTQPTLANVTIAQAPLTVTGLSGTNRTYNSSTVDALSGTATLNGLVSGQSLTLGGTTNGTLASANVGSEAVTTAITIANSGSSLASNYVLTQPTLANVTIAAANTIAAEVNPCLINPSLCTSSTIVSSQPTTSIATPITPPLAVAAGNISFSNSSGATGTLNSVTSGDINASRNDARASDSTVAELNSANAEFNSAQTPQEKNKAAIKVAIAETKQADALANQATIEAQQAKVEAQKLNTPEAQINAEVQQAIAEVKQAAAAEKHASFDIAGAKDPVVKIGAEIKLAEASSKKANAEVKQAQAEVKQADEAAQGSNSQGAQVVANTMHEELNVKVAAAGVAAARLERRTAKEPAVAEEKLTLAEAKLAKAEISLSKAQVTQAIVASGNNMSSPDVVAAKAQVEVKQANADIKEAIDALHKDNDPIGKHVAVVKLATAESKLAEAEVKVASTDLRGAKISMTKAANPLEREMAQKNLDAAQSNVEAKQAEVAVTHVRLEIKQAETAIQQAKTPEERIAAAKRINGNLAQINSLTKKSRDLNSEASKKNNEYKLAKDQLNAKVMKSFGGMDIAGTSREKLQQILNARHEFMTEKLGAALKILHANPRAAEIKVCGSEVVDTCIRSQQQAGTAMAIDGLPRVPSSVPNPTLSYLPTIRHKVAVVIGNNAYQDPDIPTLSGAVNDANAIGSVMKDKLGYEVHIVHNGTRADIVREINKVADETGSNDSVMIYYAGHGYQDAETKVGYWIPSDASSQSPRNWVSSSDINKMLGSIPSKQVILVSDSCFSGALTKEQKVTSASVAGESAQEILSKRSVTVMSSGGEEPVVDEGKEGHSIFAWHLIDKLNNVNKYKAGTGVFDAVKDGVDKEGVFQQPQYGASLSAGHETGGDYLFEVRKN